MQWLRMVCLIHGFTQLIYNVICLAQSKMLPEANELTRVYIYIVQFIESIHSSDIKSLIFFCFVARQAEVL